MARREDYERLKEHINERVIEVSAHYGGAATRKEGNRYVFRCPGCSKDTLQANPDWVNGQITGCWNGHCQVPRAASAVNFIASMENLDRTHQYKEILERGAEITGAPPLEQQKTQQQNQQESPSTTPHNGSSSSKSSSKFTKSDTPTTQASGGAAVNQDPSRDKKPEETTQDPELNDRVYRRLLSSAGLSPEVWEGLKDRGLDKDTILDAGISYIRAERGGDIMDALHAKFGRDLLRVPGFYEAEKSKTGCWSNFAGKELVLFPYHDANGLVSTIEGRVMFGKEGTVKYKYLSLTGSGSHVYVFPGMGFDNIEAFCEGLMGAIVAAQEDICVASIQGFRRYREPGGHYPLRGLRTVDFGGRAVSYIPDMDYPPNPEVAQEAPAAAEWLISKQNGSPRITLLPAGKDLDEFLLRGPTSLRRAAFDTLVQRYSRTPEEYRRALNDETLYQATPAAGPDGTGSRTKDPGAKDSGSGSNQQNPQSDQPPAEGQPAPGPPDNQGVAGRPEPEASLEPEPTHDTHNGSDEAGDHGEQNAKELSSYLEDKAPAQALAGEQFYRADFKYPEEPPDPETAVFGPRGNTASTNHTPAPTTQESQDGRTRRQRLAGHLRQSSTSVLQWALSKALTITVIWAALYVAVRVALPGLTPLQTVPTGTWKWLALAIIVCALLQALKHSRHTRFRAGTLTPGKR